MQTVVVPTCLVGCSRDTVHSLSHYFVCLAVREAMAREEGRDTRRLSLRDWCGLVGTRRCEIERGVRRQVAATMAYHGRCDDGVREDDNTRREAATGRGGDAQGDGRSIPTPGRSGARAQPTTRVRTPITPGRTGTQVHPTFPPAPTALDDRAPHQHARQEERTNDDADRHRRTAHQATALSHTLPSLPRLRQPPAAPPAAPAATPQTTPELAARTSGEVNSPRTVSCGEDASGQGPGAEFPRTQAPTTTHTQPSPHTRHIADPDAASAGVAQGPDERRGAADRDTRRTTHETARAGDADGDGRTTTPTPGRAGARARPTMQGGTPIAPGRRGAEACPTPSRQGDEE